MEGAHKKQWGCASFLLVFGLLLLMVNLGLLQLEGSAAGLILPVILLIIGIAQLIKFFTRRKGILSGLIFTVYGGLLSAAFFSKDISFGYGDIWRLWPLLLIGFAISLIAKRSSIQFSYGEPRMGGRKEVNQQDGPRERKTQIKHAMSIGNENFTSENWALENMKLNKSVGNYVFNLKKAYISEGETMLDVSVRVGNIKMTVPEELSVHIVSNVAVGENVLFNDRTDGTHARTLQFRSEDFETAPQKVKIILNVNVGSIRIDWI
ncbi:cell wall-active antibiotics response protein LiaF [Jeotgalibacillus haloalkalitolerans]|uniref:Cell wall-active antibiotics response protein LiaF n=1 Tax=Jeotgalibacillus haloalkalitolerans TaxID=3104292 RepID=A0ABU5KPQ4_9BACL|nr:cell wall-active antibiotics response protein LiaF [Jeotgalibacillus sp. HH7-29]MDZ5713068.1 cell wall-active antibiotics response protein LiaF [Jeotgalibacillus sp. HH7-29]